MKLYEISRAILDVIESGYSVDEDTGEILFEPADIDALEIERDSKLEACALYAKSLQAEADAIKAERDRLDARLKAKQGKADRMKQYIQSCMLALHDTTFETARVDMRIRQSKFVEVACDAESLPLEYQRRKVTVTADKTALKKALQDGERIPGVRMAERDSLTIK